MEIDLYFYNLSRELKVALIFDNLNVFVVVDARF